MRDRRAAIPVGIVGGGPSDTTAPTVAITSTLTSPTETTPIPITITFSEEVTGFAVGDLTVGNGAAGDFATSDDIVFTANITPTAGGAVTVDIAAGVCTDVAGNANEAATQFSITFFDLEISDTFTDTDATALSAHTIAPTNVPGATWTNLYSTGSRNITVQSNRAACPVFNEGHYGLECGTADVILSVVLRLANNTTAIQKVFLRLDALTDSAVTQRNCWQVRLGNGKFELYEHNADPAGTLRATVNMTTDAGVDYTVRVVCVGDTITATVDGANQITYTGITTHLTSTKFGIMLNAPAGTAGIADDFKVFF